MSNPKKRRFQIEPNSLSESEENSTRNVLRRLRNPTDTQKSSEELPSTTEENQSRPLFEIKPSTVKNVDVLPSTDDILPSTTEENLPKIDGMPSTEKTSAVHTEIKLPSTKSDRHKPGRARFDNRISRELVQKIKGFCLTNNLSQQEFVEMSAVHFMSMWTANNPSNVDGMPSHDDRRLRLLWKTQALIINLYLRYNSVFNPKTKWSVKDDDAASKFNDVDLRLIELGIIQTQGNKNFAGKINSFGYYAHEIESFIDLNLPTESVETMLQINRKRWQMATGKSVPETSGK